MISRRGEWRTWERRNPGPLGKKPKEFTVLAPRRDQTIPPDWLESEFVLSLGGLTLQLAQLGCRAKSLVLTTLFVHRHVLDISIVVARGHEERRHTLGLLRIF